MSADDAVRTTMLCCCFHIYRIISIGMMNYAIMLLLFDDDM